MANEDEAGKAKTALGSILPLPRTFSGYATSYVPWRPEQAAWVDHCEF